MSIIFLILLGMISSFILNDITYFEDINDFYYKDFETIVLILKILLFLIIIVSFFGKKV